jgi:hypothetical protein
MSQDIYTITGTYPHTQPLRSSQGNVVMISGRHTPIQILAPITGIVNSTLLSKYANDFDDLMFYTTHSGSINL